MAGAAVATSASAATASLGLSSFFLLAGAAVAATALTSVALMALTSADVLAGAAVAATARMALRSTSFLPGAALARVAPGFTLAGLSGVGGAADITLTALSLFRSATSSVPNSTAGSSPSRFFLGTVAVASLLFSLIEFVAATSSLRLAGFVFAAAVTTASLFARASATSFFLILGAAFPTSRGHGVVRVHLLTVAGRLTGGLLIYGIAIDLAAGNVLGGLGR